MGTKNLGSGNDFFKAHKEGGFLGFGEEWRPWTINGNGGNDTLIGGEKNDTIDGGIGADSIDGGIGADSILGGAGNDTLRSGNDTVVDTLKGGLDQDTYFVKGNDIVVELANQGFDTVYVSDATNYTLSSEVDNLVLDSGSFHGFGNSLGNGIYGNEKNNFLDGAGGNDLVFGRDGNDTVAGAAGNDVLFGERGNDRVFGEAGDDYISGVSTNSSLTGISEVDTLFGERGSDTFELGSHTIYYNGGVNDEIVNGKLVANADYAIIDDFFQSEGDRIKLRGRASDYRLERMNLLGSSTEDTVILYQFGGTEEVIGVAKDTNLTLFGGLSSTNFIYA